LVLAVTVAAAARANLLYISDNEDGQFLLS
jgi:hypothetical protein